jgi:hypothetical protein
MLRIASSPMPDMATSMNAMTAITLALIDSLDIVRLLQMNLARLSGRSNSNELFG